jgi:hypothetical protein
MCPEFILTKGPCEEASRVFPALQVDDKSTLQSSLGENQDDNSLLSAA